MDRYKLSSNKISDDGAINFDLGVGEDFANNLFQSTLFDTSYMEKVKEENINDIIDYEKHMFYPAYLTNEIHFNSDGSFTNKGNLVEVNDGNGNYSQDLDSYSRDVNKIIFNLYLKQRGDNQAEEYEDWAVKDEAYWNRWDGSRIGIRKKLDNERSTNENGDLLGYLGFNDNDVFYQKNNLKKSFLRISIYDSPYKQSQKLLYYSTLFFDTNVLYKKYTNLNNYIRTVKDGNEIPRVYEYSSGIPDEEKLTATFTCTSKLDNSACSDGFYLYLFNTIVENGRCTPLYMKVEFNNAKYGKTALLTCPRIMNRGKMNRIGIGDLAFPEDYEIEYGSETPKHSYIDINTLYRDLYIPIFVRYNNSKNRFEWYIADNVQANKEKSSLIPGAGDTMIINLYEPKINKLKRS